MEFVIGTVIVVLALFILTILTFWSRNKINKLAENNFPNTRDAERINDRE